MEFSTTVSAVSCSTTPVLQCPSLLQVSAAVVPCNYGGHALPLRSCKLPLDALTVCMRVSTLEKHLRCLTMGCRVQMKFIKLPQRSTATSIVIVK